MMIFLILVLAQVALFGFYLPVGCRLAIKWEPMLYQQSKQWHDSDKYIRLGFERRRVAACFLWPAFLVWMICSGTWSDAYKRAKMTDPDELEKAIKKRELELGFNDTTSTASNSVPYRARTGVGKSIKIRSPW